MEAPNRRAKSLPVSSGATDSVEKSIGTRIVLISAFFMELICGFFLLQASHCLRSANHFLRVEADPGRMNIDSQSPLDQIDESCGKTIDCIAAFFLGWEEHRSEFQY